MEGVIAIQLKLHIGPTLLSSNKKVHQQDYFIKRVSIYFSQAGWWVASPLATC